MSCGKSVLETWDTRIIYVYLAACIGERVTALRKMTRGTGKSFSRGLEVVTDASTFPALKLNIKPRVSLQFLFSV